AVLRLSRSEAVGRYVLPYLNRLSDLLFVLSRWAGKVLGEPEHLWERGLRGSGKA
ncbi:MAG: ATP:cob(I)alamin adenosyltransferase, partial [Deltaproteobacteria bacterium]